MEKYFVMTYFIVLTFGMFLPILLPILLIILLIIPRKVKRKIILVFRKYLKVFKYIFIVIFLSLFTMCLNDIHKTKKRREQTSRDLLESIVKELKENNLIIKKEDYDVKFLSCSGQITCNDYYELKKKNLIYKSKYFNQNYSLSAIVNPNITLGNPYYSLSAIVNPNFKLGKPYGQLVYVTSEFGLRTYVLNEFIYDKSKGNNFEEIEKIFDSYPKGTIVYYFGYSGWTCYGLKEFDDHVGINFVKNDKCDIEKLNYKGERYYERNNLEEVQKYAEKYREYFSVPRELDKMDFEEYIKIHEIYPVIEFRTRYLTEEEIEELRKKIEPYYNKDIMYIYIFEERFDETDIIYKIKKVFARRQLK